MDRESLTKILDREGDGMRKIVEGEAVVAGDEVYALLRFPFFVAIDMAAGAAGRPPQS